MEHTKEASLKGETFDRALYKRLNCTNNMVQTVEYLGYQDLRHLRRFQATHCFLGHFFESHDQQYSKFKGASAFKSRDDSGEDLRETSQLLLIFFIRNRYQRKRARNARIAETI